MSSSPSAVQILEAAGQKQLTQRERFEKVRTLVHPSSESASKALAAEVAALIRERAAAGKTTVLGLATGSTPVPYYRELIRLHQEEGLSFESVTTFNLDEYYGLPRDHPESYFRFMRDQLFDHVDLDPSRIHIPDGTVPMEAVYDHCLDYERRIIEAGGLDVQILGIGRTGHIGFNEPGSSADSITRMITLDRVTRQDAAADFMGVANVPRSAITMGVGTILEAKRLVLMAWGANKASIVREAVEGKVTDQISASFLQNHGNATFLVDEAAASNLTRFRFPWLVGPVEWDAPMKKRAVVWLARKLDKPILKLVDEDYNENGAGGLLASTSEAAYEVNIDIFNRVQHTITGWPGGKPGIDDSRRPERSEPFPKRILVLSPEPADALIGMGGTLSRLREQGHEVKLVFQTSGNLRVADVAALNFARVVLEMAETSHSPEWESQTAYARSIVEAIDAKGEFGIDPDFVRKLKGLILRGEARDAASVCRLRYHDNQFLDLPFYETGRYRRFRFEAADAESVRAILAEFQPHSIYATGDASDPSSPQAIAFRAFTEAWKGWDGGTRQESRVWLYRGRDRPFEAHEIDMAVPMSPDQLEEKAESIRRFMSINEDDLNAPARNREIAATYDALGMAEYEAIEAFRRWIPA
ncbi:MAG: glucosamine-6-phosphate deaminase [Verrucomicrobiales bacterium]|nr:glucosamine-6-phosphate deaminase [Verrucomicrobiales bacterium]